MISLVLFESLFPIEDFHVVEVTFDQLTPKEIQLLKKNQSNMNDLMGSYEPSVREFNKISNVNNVDNMFDRMKKNKSIIYVLRNKDNEIVGHAFITRMMIKNRFHLSYFYLDKNYRSGGLGTFFLSEVEKQLKKNHNGSVLQLSCLNKNDAGNKLYQKLGYGVIRRDYAKKI